MKFDRANQTPIHLAAIRKAHPDKSIPDGDLADLGYYDLILTPTPPAFDPATQRIERGEYLIDHDARTATETWRVVDMTDEEIAEWAANHPPPSYRELRAAAYGSMPEQLDMIYWDSVNGTTVWRDHIAAVKATYPKPADE